MKEKVLADMENRDITFLKNSKKRFFYMEDGRVYSLDGEGAERSVYVYKPSPKSFFSMGMLDGYIIYSESFKEFRSVKEKNGLMGVRFGMERDPFGTYIAVSHPDVRKRLRIPVFEPGSGGEMDVGKIVSFVKGKRRGNLVELVVGGPYLNDFLSEATSSKYNVVLLCEEGILRFGFPTASGMETMAVPNENVVYLSESFPERIVLNLTFPLSMVKSLKEETDFFRIAVGRKRNGMYVEAETDFVKAVYGQ